MRCFRRRRMIEPGMAATYDDARRVCERRGIWMVEYLRARRRPDRLLIAFYRRKHLSGNRR